MNVNFWFWLRAFAMFLGLIATIVAIRNLNQFKAADAPVAKVNLCPTRVTAITTASGVSVMQEGMAWFRKNDGRMEELDPIAVEKWFGRHCMVSAERAAAGAETQPLATIAFVSGPEQTLFSAGSNAFQWMDQIFHSQELTEALKSLEEIPIRLRPSR